MIFMLKIISNYMDKLPFETGIVDPAEEFEQWMREEEERMKTWVFEDPAPKRREVKTYEKTRQVGVNPSLFVCRNRIFQSVGRGKT